MSSLHTPQPPLSLPEFIGAITILVYIDLLNLLLAIAISNITDVSLKTLPPKSKLPDSLQSCSWFRKKFSLITSKSVLLDLE
jgi:hypothetical protein